MADSIAKQISSKTQQLENNSVQQDDIEMQIREQEILLKGEEEELLQLEDKVDQAESELLNYDQCFNHKEERPKEDMIASLINSIPVIQKDSILSKKSIPNSQQQ